MQKGFTLIELLVTITLVAIMAVLAMPSFSSMVTNNRMAAVSNDFVSSLHLARTEAVKRGEDVIICAAKDDLTGCKETADADSNWSDGWVITVWDPPPSPAIPEIPAVGLIPAVPAVPATSGIRSVIHSHEALGGDELYDVTDTVGTNVKGQITFNHYGFSPASARTVRLCDPSDDAKNARGIIITTSGRIILASDTDTTPDHIRNDGDSNNLSCTSP